MGGSVRDALLGVEGPIEEIDFTTDARPEEIEALMRPLCRAVWEQGREFGTIGGTLAFATETEDDGSTHDVLTGDYASAAATWAPSELPPGQRLQEPQPLFRTLPPAAAAEALARLGM